MGGGWPDRGCCLGLLSRRKRARWGSGQGLLQKAGEGIAEGLLAWGWKGAVRFQSWAPGKGDFEGLCLLKGPEVWGHQQYGGETQDQSGCIKGDEMEADGSQALC